MTARGRRLASAAAALLAVLVLAGYAVHARGARPSLAHIAAAPLPAPAARYVTRRLGNGLDVVVIEDHAAPVAQTSVWYGSGSLDEPRGQIGIAHALEHMMFRGTPALSSGGLFHVVGELGAAVNGTTALDWTRYDLVVPAGDVGVALSIEADRMANATLSESDWRVERGAVLEEIDAANSEPVARLVNAVRRAAYGASAYAATPLGTRANVERVSAAQLRTYYRRWYVPNNAMLVVAGDVDPQRVIALAAQRFGALRARALPHRSVNAPPFAHDQHVRINADYPFTVLDLAYPGYGAADVHYPASVVITTVINNERSAFHRALIEDGLAFGYQSSADTSRGGALLHVTAILRPGVSAERARAAIDGAFETYRRDGVPPDLVDATRRASAASAIYDRDSVAGLATRVGWALTMTGNDPARLMGSIASVRRDTLASILATMRGPVVGELVPISGKRNSVRTTATKGGVAADDFSARRPSGPIVEPAWAARSLRSPVAYASKVLPRRYVLSNGLRLYVQPVHENVTVFVQGSVDGSPAFDPPGKTGLGAFASLAMGYGGTTYDFASQRAIADDLAARFKFGRVFQARGMARDLPALLTVLADGELRPSFPDQYVQLVRDQAVQRIQHRAADPDYLAERALAKLLLPPGDQELREESVASVGAISTADLREYVQRYFRPDLTSLVVVGDVDPDGVRRSVERTFGAWRSSGRAPNTDLPPIRSRSGRATIPSERADVAVTLAGPGVTRSDPDFLTATVANAILGGEGDFETRLFVELREKRGLVYQVSSSLAAGRSRSHTEIRFDAAPHNVAAALALTTATMRGLQEHRIDDGALERVKRKMLAESSVAEASTQFIVGEVARIADNDLAPDYYRRLPGAVAKISAADVQRVARGWLDPSRFVIVERGPVQK